MLISATVLIGLVIISHMMDHIYKGKEGIKLGDLFFYTMLLSLLGARLIYALFHMEVYQSNLTALWTISRYNLSYVGGMFTGSVILFVVSKWKKISFIKTLDKLIIPLYLLCMLITLSAFAEGYVDPLAFHTLSLGRTLMLLFIFGLGALYHYILREKETRILHILLGLLIISSGYFIA